MLSRVAGRRCCSSRPFTICAPSVPNAHTILRGAFLTAMPPRTRSRLFLNGGNSKAVSDAVSVPSTPTPVAAAGAVSAKTDLDVPREEKALRIARQLRALYPNPPIPLDHESTFQLLVAVILSAQSTDKKVNEITPRLFKMAPDAAAMSCLTVEVIQEAIREIGLSKTKANNISKTAKMLVDQHGGQVPSSFKELEALAGVGHKTASVVMAQAFNNPSFPVDTHIHRLAQRWGLTCGKNVEKTEADLKAAFSEQTWNDLHLQIIYFGREHCPAQRHDPNLCPICCWAAVPPYDQPGASPFKPGQSPGGKAKAPAQKRSTASDGILASGRGAKVKKAIESAGSPVEDRAAKRKEKPRGSTTKANQKRLVKRT